jgi:GT2 family glycosyltransferase
MAGFIEITDFRDMFCYMPMERQTVVAIPVRNEERHLTACLAALCAQTRPADAIVLLLNNCTDGSLDICRRARHSCPAIHIVECTLHGDEACAGEARRRALEYAQKLAGDGVILTTDADSIVPATWIADNLAGIADGADCVCGMAVIEPEAVSNSHPRLQFDDMRETLLLNLQDEIAAIADPDPADPWPRHQQNSGASIAMRADMLRLAGGAPRVAAGEDRALVANLAMVDAKIRHAPHIKVVVSGRLHGRAAGGMAETITRRMQRPDWHTDEMLEPTVDAYRRVLTRLRLRGIRNGDLVPEGFATDLLIMPESLQAALQARYFGTAWASIQRASPVLRRRRVAYMDLARETRQAIALRDDLRANLAHHPHMLPWASSRHAV